MFKFLFILAIGIVLGYGYGWSDALTHDKAIHERIVERIGGDNRERVSADIDAKMDAAEGR